MRRAGAALVSLFVAWAQASAQGLVISNDDNSLPRAAGGASEREAAAARVAARGMEGKALHAVQVQGRWAKGLQLPFTPCAALSAERNFAVMEAVRDALRAPAWLDSEASGRGQVQILYLDVDIDQAPAGSCAGGPAVDLVIRPYRVQIATERLGDNVLPLARQAFGTAFSQVPEALLALNPALAIRRDAASGTLLRLDLRLAADALARGLAGELGVQRSVDGPYRDDHLALTWRHPLSAGIDARLRLGARSQRAPSGEGTVEQHDGDLAAGATLRLAPTRRLWLDVTHQSQRARTFDHAGVAGIEQAAGVGSARVLLDWLLAESLSSVRAGIWRDRARGRERSVFLLAGAREIRWRPAQLIGIEAAIVAGRADAGAPDTRRFRGGTPDAQWLYDSPGSPALLAMPDGPVLRSAGRRQAQLGQGAAARGGTRFWSLGLSAAWPVARWYRPLIPDETTDLQLDESKPPLTLKQLLMKQVDVTGPNLLAATLSAQGMSADEAHRQAQAALAEVRPAVRYIVEDAPLLAVRPLLMLDLAGLSDGGPGTDASARWAAVGVGAQVQMATARFEAGYMRTVSGPVHGRSRGAFVLRLNFQNLF